MAAISPTLAQARLELQHQILRIACPGLAVYYSLVTAAHAGFLEEPLRSMMMGVAGGSALIFALLSVVRDRRPVRDHAQLVALLLALVVVCNSGIHLVATGEVFQTTNLLFTVVGAGVLLTSAPLFALTLGLAAVWFCLGLWQHPADPLWPHFGFALFAADSLAIIVFAIRRSTHRGLVEAEEERDQTELARKLRAAEALAHESRYRVVVSLSPAAIVVHRHGLVLFANQAASQLIGAGDASVLTGSRLYDLFPPEDEERIASWNEAAIVAALGNDRLESRLRALQGPWPFVELAATAITWEDEPAAILVATDVSARRELEVLQQEILRVAEQGVRYPVRSALDALARGDSQEAQERLEHALEVLDGVRERARGDVTAENSVG